MLLRLCQLKSLSLLFVIITLKGCSWRQDDGRAETELLTTFPNKWFSVSKNHSLVDNNHVPLPHLLFDSNPELKTAARTVNVVIATPEDSPHAYSVDLNSGQRHYTHSYCKQKDIWSVYNGSINRPTFSIGYIPRVLDQLGEAQKIIVWSKRKSFQKTALTNYHRVKLVGAYVEQICPEGNCLGKSNWLSRLVFIGVDAEDPAMLAIETVDDFKKTFDWKASKATLENIEGRNFIGDQTYPAIRVGQLIEYPDAFDFFNKRSIFLTDTELKKIQRGCHILYDRLWDEVGKVRPEDRPTNTIEELKSKMKLQEAIKKQKLPVGFAARVHSFTKRYFNEISTCEKFVYHGNINHNREAFWFLSYMGLFYRLHREGYYFDCPNRAWRRNVLNDQAETIHDLKRDIGECKELEFDQAMEYLPNFLASLKGEKDYFRFVDYDNHSFGSHRKMYSWIKVKSRKFDCSNNENVEIRKEMRLFPDDVRWKMRKVKDIADNMKIIF
jgi:hypothetical protein